MKQTLKRGLVLSAMAVLALASCKSKETPDNPDKPKVIKTLDHLIIKEIYLGGTQHDKGYKSDNDAYIKIYNPTNAKVYLDGLALVMSGFSSNDRLELASGSDFRDQFLAVNKLLLFPGNGTEYPIEPGKEVLIAQIAQNLTEDVMSKDEDVVIQANKNSFDLRNANFEWTTVEQLSDDDIPNSPVPNLTMPYGGGAEFFDGPEDGEEESLPLALNLNKTKGMIALVKLGVKDTKELKDAKYRWDCTWNRGTSSHAHANHATYLKCPKEWIIDAVNLCPKGNIQWEVVNKEIDKGGTYTTKETSKADPVNNALVRRHDGRSYVDTNDSTVDFEEAKPSLAKK